ncbi:hypothetical protein A2Z10_01865 [Candidatus Azambacteria bacterium RBG_16_47_10]|uniref:UDP-N-acetylmuramate--L-alanine ligase n=1 Tax=Candidatus Azambacteria bacterium RBG_16_47_10 TaxID=1797292 RepID=A0A1F5AZD1_9BACT|nr:MAG: hypothetical protein A2Z10_01865 [Candidatus Azambacteria bacterium RBG_16_47_10]
MERIKQYKKIHMIGVKGVGMTALAEVLLANGFSVTGSDVHDEFMTDAVLARLGIAVSEFGEEHVHGADAIVRSNAYTEENEEVKEAVERNIPLFSYPEVVAELFNAHRGIAVAGSHGKTTTTAMLAHILKAAEKNVTAIVGSRVIDWGSGAVAGDLSKDDALFVLEADEYKEAFLHYQPHGAIITNIDYDHPDYFANPEDYRKAFEKFVALIPATGFLIMGDNDETLAEVARNAACKVVVVREEDREEFSLHSPGAHYQFDANLAYRAALECGVAPAVARAALESFHGTARRLEYIGERNGAIIIDDYAHHPSELKATLAGIAEKYKGKHICAVFQPHTFSRTRALFDDFAGAFTDAESVVLMHVYASAREKKEGNKNMVDMAVMADKVNEIAGKKKAVYIEDRNDVIDHVRALAKTNTVIVTFGAGDIWQIARALCEKEAEG